MKKFFLRVGDMTQGLQFAVRQLYEEWHRHDVLVEALRAVELDQSLSHTGFGGFPNIVGNMEQDAIFMDGNTRNVGAVSGLSYCLPAVVALELMKRGMHTLIVGEGANIFAREAGIAPEQTLSLSQQQAWEQNIKPLLDKRGPNQSLMDLVKQVSFGHWQQQSNFDTTIMMVADKNGVSGGGTTSGWPYKHPGRASDTLVPGAGLYVHSRYGACCCTHTGEMSIRASPARYVVAQMEMGASVQEAVENAVEDIAALEGGVLSSLVIYAVKLTDGNPTHFAAAINLDEDAPYQYWEEGAMEPQLQQARHYTVSKRSSFHI